MQRSKWFAFVLGLSTLLAAQSAQAQLDNVKRVGGATTTGKFKSMSKDGVVIFANSLDNDVPANEIVSITYASEPADVRTAQLALRNGRFNDAKETLSEVVMDNLPRDEIKHEVAYALAVCDANLAMTGEVSVDDALKSMLGFVGAYRDSYHFYEACELLGDLSVRKGDFTNAKKYYGQLNSAPWADYRMKAGVLAGRAAQAQNDHAGAIRAFEYVLKQSSDTPEGKRATLAATLGKAVSLTESNPAQAATAIDVVQKVINDAAPEETDLHARAYNALGKCYLTTGNDQEALMAFLHVDVVFNSNPDEHAEALSNLATVWGKVGKADRAREAAAMLKEYYPNSKWAQR
ncbi:MAG: tetratricopeptide repeat protein [Planctomycetales bacterium]|nr:tetratricopeptide repeat protein [Planctomycetales bacterium]